MDDLVQRFEEPNDFTRWDKPLFTILATDELITYCGDGIVDAIFNKQGATARMSTLVV